MKQRFYYITNDPNRWHVYMGSEAMQLIGGGLHIVECGYEEIAQAIVRQYTQQFNDMVDAEDSQITESV